MAELYALTNEPLPKSLHGTDAECSIRSLSERERLSIEDYFFRKEVKKSLDPATTAVVVPQSLLPRTKMNEFGTLIEFGLGILSVSGFQSVMMTAIFDSVNCTDALILSDKGSSDPATFPKAIKKNEANAWMRRLFAALGNTKDHMHITADRFVRYCKAKGSLDSLLDLCICLESLLDSQTEIAFRFGTCLTKVTERTGTDAEEVSNLLLDLYDLRSRIVHGADAAKQHKKIDPHVAKLRRIARRILTTYVLYMSAHTRDEWKNHLKSSIFK